MSIRDDSDAVPSAVEYARVEGKGEGQRERERERERERHALVNIRGECDRMR